MPPFTAKYNSVCALCTESISAGDVVTRAADAVVHALCPVHVPEKGPNPVCNTCFTERANNGACACID